MNHLEVWAEETRESESLIKWRKFYAEAEAILRHSLDGDLGVNGFSQDEAYGFFLAGKKGREYADMVRARPGYNPEQNWA
jgi:hypothetical protein